MKRKLHIMGFIIAAVLLAATLVLPVGNIGAQEKQLVVSVVEDIPVEELENGRNMSNALQEDGIFELGDPDVPLAAFPGSRSMKDSGSSDGARHIALMGLFCLCMILYIVIRVRSEKTLFHLRKSAAQAEQAMINAGNPLYERKHRSEQLR